MIDKLLSRVEAAAYLGISPTTLDRWACLGTYKLTYIKVGKLAKYRLSELDKFLESHTVKQEDK